MKKLKNLSIESQVFFKRAGFNLEDTLDDARNKDGHSPLSYAIFHHATLIPASELIRNGATISQEIGKIQLKEGVISPENVNKTENIVNTTPLISAAMLGSLDIVTLLLKHGAKTELLTNCGNNALMFAAMKGHDKIVSLLMNVTPDINQQDKNGNTALLNAIGKKTNVDHHPKCINLLLKHPDIDLEKADNNGYTALLTASDHLDLVEKLIKMKAKINAKDSFGQTTLFLASHERNFPVVKCLVENKADMNIVSNGGESPLAIAMRKNFQKIVKYLIKNGASLNCTHNVTTFDEMFDALQLAVNQQNLEKPSSPFHTNDDPRFGFMMKFSQALNSKSNKTQDFDILSAAKVSDAIQSLTDKIKNNQGNANSKATETKENMEDLVIRKMGFSLFVAAAKGDVKRIRELHTSGVDLNYVHREDDKSATALHNACLYKKYETAALLIELGADKNSKTAKGRTPLDIVNSKIKDEALKAKFEALFQEPAKTSTIAERTEIEEQDNTKESKAEEQDNSKEEEAEEQQDLEEIKNDDVDQNAAQKNERQREKYRI